jgi:predicted transcriptional regulator
MPQSTLEMTKDLVLAQIQTDSISPEDLDSAMRRIYQSLQTLKGREESGFPVAVPVSITPRAPADWRKNITRHSIICLECGAHFRQLSGRHLRLHGLDARSYRRKFGIPSTQPLTAREAAAKRRQIAAAVRPWEKSPQYMKAQEERAATAKKSGRKRATRGR